MLATAGWKWMELSSTILQYAPHLPPLKIFLRCLSGTIPALLRPYLVTRAKYVLRTEGLTVVRQRQSHLTGFYCWACLGPALQLSCKGRMCYDVLLAGTRLDDP